MQQKYTVGHRDFGIDKNVINVVVETCPVCLMGTRFKSNGIKNGSSCHLVNDKLPHLGFNGKCSSETLSMVANVPDSKCMWFDKSGRHMMERKRRGRNNEPASLKRQCCASLGF